MRALVVMALLSCAPEPLPQPGHAVIVLDTDAAVPALFDRVRIEVLSPGAESPCDGCTRVFDLDAELLREGASFTVTVPDSVLRVQMYVSRFAVNQQPNPGSTVERWVRVPAIPTEGAAVGRVHLPTDDVGLVRGTREAPLETDALVPSRVGTWAHAARVPCRGEPRAGEVCVPGGAYWMGNPRYRASPLLAIDQQRLVVVRPFYIDDREVTVAAARAVVSGRPDVLAYSGTLEGTALANWCRFTAAPGPFDDVPINCIARTAASAVCAARGSELPSEAQFEYVAGALVSRTFGWGDDEVTCDDAVFARGAAGMAAGGGVTCGARRGQSGTASNGGPLPLPADRTSLEGLVAYSRRRAAVLLPGGAVWDLAGNLAELTRDRYQLQDEPCWRRADGNVFVDPVCTERSGAAIVRALGDDLYTLRGGSWSDTLGVLAAASRTPANGQPSPQVGFRCVRDAGG